jgi:hypothetical protein
MENGTKEIKKSRFKSVVPVMIYMSPEDRKNLHKYCAKQSIAASVIAREGIRMRLAGEEDVFNKGFNEGLDKAMQIVNATDGAKMMFPSGKSFAELVNENIADYMRLKS